MQLLTFFSVPLALLPFPGKLTIHGCLCVHPGAVLAVTRSPPPDTAASYRRAVNKPARCIEDWPFQEDVCKKLDYALNCVANAASTCLDSKWDLRILYLNEVITAEKQDWPFQEDVCKKLDYALNCVANAASTCLDSKWDLRILYLNEVITAEKQERE